MRNMMNGLEAGLVASIALSALIDMQAITGVMPELDLSRMFSGLIGNPGMPILGWVIHFTIGVVLYGIAIALLSNRWPGRSHVGHGVTLGIAGWLVMMVLLMSRAGAGLFGVNTGVMAPMVTLVLHLVFGAVLGWVYDQSVDGENAMATRPA
jgi:uncharacterized membrane protein YagU involved in acid resistance